MPSRNKVAQNLSDVKSAQWEQGGWTRPGPGNLSRRKGEVGIAEPRGLSEIGGSDVDGNFLSDGRIRTPDRLAVT